MAGNDSYTVLLVQSDTTDGSTTFTDTSIGGTTHTLTAAGDVEHNTTVSKFGATSIYFDGTGDWLTIPDHADFYFGSDDFTIDFWLYRSNNTALHQLFGNLNSSGDADSGMACTMYDYTHPAFYWAHSDTTVDDIETSTTQIGVASWTHLAIVRDGTDLVLYIDGVSKGTTSSSKSLLDSSQVLYIGLQGDSGSVPVSGYIDEFRISKGIARWTTDFTPPTESYTEDVDPVAIDSGNVGIGIGISASVVSTIGVDEGNVGIGIGISGTLSTTDVKGYCGIGIGATGAAAQQPVSGNVGIGLGISAEGYVQPDLTGNTGIGLGVSGTVIAYSGLSGNIGIGLGCNAILTNPQYMTGNCGIGIGATGEVDYNQTFVGNVGIGIGITGQVDNDGDTDDSCTLPSFSSDRWC